MAAKTQASYGIGPSWIHPLIKEVDPAAEFLYRPRTVTVLVIGLACLFYFSDVLGYGQTQSVEVRMRRGVAALAVAFLAYSSIYAPVTSLTRPHPIVWRVVHGVSLLYFLFLVFLLFLEGEQAPRFMRHLHPELGVPLDERFYGADCRIRTPEHPESAFANVRDTVLDEFVLAHLFGWVAKALIFRDWTVLFVLSIGFELMELTFQHVMPNFNECWWDSWVLDVALCNNIGMLVGMYLMRRGPPEGEPTRWRGISSQPTLLLKARRFFLQFTPASIERYKWRMLESPKRLVQVVMLMAACLACEVNAFFMKYVLWVPPRNLFNTYRLFIFFGMVIPAVSEYYEFIDASAPAGDQGKGKGKGKGKGAGGAKGATGRKGGKGGAPVRKLGVFMWLFVSCTLVEFLIIYKFGRKDFDKPWPTPVKVAWGIAGAAFAVTLAVWSLMRGVDGGKGKRKAH